MGRCLLFCLCQCCAEDSPGTRRDHEVLPAEARPPGPGGPVARGFGGGGLLPLPPVLLSEGAQHAAFQVSVQTGR